MRQRRTRSRSACHARTVARWTRSSSIRLDGPADEIKPAQILSGSLTFGKKVTVRVCIRPGGPAVPARVCRRWRRESGWTFAANLKSAWLEVNLGQLSVFDTAEIHERYDRIRTSACR